MNPYAEAPGRERQKRATQTSILEAVERCLARGGLDELTYAQIAGEAGVADRTIYRYFPTKEALLEAFWLRVHETLGLEQSVRSFADYLATRPQAFAEMDRREPVMRAVMASSQARQARRRLGDLRRDGIRKVVADAAPGLPEPRFTELCALVHLLGSAPAWQALKDGWGLEAEQSGPLVARAIATLVEAARTEASDPNPKPAKAKAKP